MIGKVTLALAVALSATASRAAPKAAPLPTVIADALHDLSTPTGLLAVSSAALFHDRVHGETFVSADGFVRIFDSSGMEVHRFGDDGSLGYVMRAISLEDGDLVVIASKDGSSRLLRCDFRGDLIGPIELKGLPEPFADFRPEQVTFQRGNLYFAERGTARVVITDIAGQYRMGYRLRDLVQPSEDGERKGLGFIDGFNVDAAGNIWFTSSMMFSAGVVSTAGEVRFFGRRGSRPGSFNVVGGIDVDEEGHVFVTDRLRSVVSVWDKDLVNLGEFGYRGDDATNLIAPFEIAVGKDGRLFVAQGAQRGVKVFKVQFIEPPPPAALPADLSRASGVPKPPVARPRP